MGYKDDRWIKSLNSDEHDPDGARAGPGAAALRRRRSQGAHRLRGLPRADATWQASSFDLAQGLDVKVMQSKLSTETLDRLFRG